MLAFAGAPAAVADENEVPGAFRDAPELGLTPEQLRALFAPPGGGSRTPGRYAIPDVFGHGAVLDVGKVVMKVTNFGCVGNPFVSSSDPSCQWPGASGNEYMNLLTLGIGAVNPQASDPIAIRRVSFFQEMRPATLEPEDRIYPAYDGIVNGVRYGNDDSDFDPYGKPRIDEDFLDGRDNDGDGRVDEDFGALGQKMFSLVMRDDTPEALNFAQAEPHVPLGIELRQRAWAYSLSQFENFNVLETQVTNVSGHELDSLVVGFFSDLDAGAPLHDPGYFNDDFDVPGYPQGEFRYVLPETDSRRQAIHSAALYGTYPAGTPLCNSIPIRVNGYSVADDNGDEGTTDGVVSVLLFDHTTDPLGESGPSRVGWRSYRSYPRGTAYVQRGGPAIDQQRFELLTSTENIVLDGDPETNPMYGFVEQAQGDQKGDYRAWTGVGPYRHVQHGQSVTVTIGISVSPGTLRLASAYPAAYRRYLTGQLTQQALFEQFPSVATAFAAQVAFEGIWERRGGFDVTDDHGRETEVCVPLTGQTVMLGDCRDGENVRSIAPGQCAWFDFDCDYCTGVYDSQTGIGLFHKYWNASAPPPNPNTNVSTGYNFSDNPNRTYAPGEDGAVLLAWDNLSETTPDPSESREFDFRGYKIWKAAGWTRPTGSPGPADDQWSLLAEYRLFDYRNDRSHEPIADNRYWLRVSASESTLVCPRVWVPLLDDSMDVCLRRGDFFDRQSGTILRPDTTRPCVGSPDCETEVGNAAGYSRAPLVISERRTKYPIGRYRYVDHEVRNGFMYFYAITAFDSSKSESGVTTELEGRRAAVEAEAVVPQAGTKPRGVWVVPNPYRGFADIAHRSSAWDLTPNASDPTGTHVDFVGLPPGHWRIRIYTVSGDLVQELHPEDAVNESVRGPVTLPSGQAVPGYNRQQDTPNDGQARWNLISRNGQDVVSGIYLYTVESDGGDVQRGRFVIVR